MINICQLISTYHIKTQETRDMEHAEQHRSLFNVIWLVLELPQRYSWVKSPELTQFLRRGECCAMMFQGSRNLDQPIAHWLIGSWVVAMFWYIFWDLQFQIISLSINYSKLHGGQEWERSRKTRLARLQKEMEKLQTTITHDEDYIARPGGMNFSNMLFTAIYHEVYYCISMY